MIAIVAIERVVFLGEVGHEEAEATAMVVVADRDAHAALLGAVLADRNAERKRLLLERPILLIHIHEVRRRIVRDIQVRPSVVVVIEPGDAQSEIAVGIGYAGLFRDLGEMSVAVVVKEEVGFTRQSARSALHGNSAVLAGLVLSELRQPREIDLHIAADEKIETAVAVVIGEPAPGRPSRTADPGPFGEIFERAVAAIAIEAVAADTG